MASIGDNPIVERRSAHFRNHSARFLLPPGAAAGRSFCRQYAHLYATRLALQRPLLEAEARRRWPPSPLRRVCELAAPDAAPDASPDRSLEDSCVVVVGTLVRLGARHGSALKELVAEVEAPGELVVEELAPVGGAAQDSVFLEDEIQRIELSVDTAAAGFERRRLVTGVVCALLGRVCAEEGGRFVVRGAAFAPPAPQPAAWPCLMQDKWLCVVSGLELGGRRADLLALRLLQEQLCGALAAGGVPAEHVVRLLVAGNALSRESADQAASVRARYLRKRGVEVKSVAAQALWDAWLAQLLPSLPCALMPGEWDPAGSMLPQQPLHRCMFPRAAAAGPLALLPNPAHFEMDGVHFLGSSGQNVRDVVLGAEQLRDGVEGLEQLLRWGHLAPTAPDSLPCHPFSEGSDPLLLRQAAGVGGGTPHVFFAGGQSQLESRQVQLDGVEGAVLLLSVPSFALSGGVCALLNLRTRCVRGLRLDTSWLATMKSAKDAEAAVSPKTELVH